MVWVTRKATGKVVGRNVPDESIELYLSVLPTGVYAIEDSDGNELNVAIVKGGRVKFVNWPIGPAVSAVTVSPDVLRSEGYTEIAGQDGEGEVTLRNDCGGLEVFAVRDSYAGWSIPTDQGKVLEFCRSV